VSECKKHQRISAKGVCLDCGLDLRATIQRQATELAEAEKERDRARRQLKIAQLCKKVQAHRAEAAETRADTLQRQVEGMRQLHKELGQLKWAIGQDEGWELAVKAVREEVGKILGVKQVSDWDNAKNADRDALENAAKILRPGEPLVVWRSPQFITQDDYRVMVQYEQRSAGTRAFKAWIEHLDGRDEQGNRKWRKLTSEEVGHHFSSFVIANLVRFNVFMDDGNAQSRGGYVTALTATPAADAPKGVE
jgi:hypothetical protein